MVIGPMNLNLMNNINSTNDNNTYSKLLNKRMSLISPKTSTNNNLNNCVQKNADLKIKSELNISINLKINNFEKILSKIFKNQNYLTINKNYHSEEKNQSSNRVLTEGNLNNNDLFTNLNTITEKPRIEIQPAGAISYASRKSFMVNQPLKKKKSIISNQSLLTKENSNIFYNQININNNNSNQTGNTNLNTNINNTNNNIINNSTFLGNHISGYSELFVYFKENNLNLNKFAEFFFLLNSQFNLLNNLSINNNNTTSNTIQENQMIKSNYNSNNDLASNSSNFLDYYSVFLGKALKYKIISRDKIQPYKELKNNINFMFVLEGNNSEMQKFFDDLNLVLTEILINHLKEESKLTSLFLDKRISNFLDNKIFFNKKENLLNVNFSGLIANPIFNNTNNLNQNLYNRYNNFSIIQEESNPNNFINSNTINSNTGNVINSNNQIGQILHRSSTISINNPNKKRNSFKSSVTNPVVDDKQGVSTIYIPSNTSPSRQPNSQFYNNANLNNFSNLIGNNNFNSSPNNKNNPSGSFMFNPSNIHNLINTQSNSNLTSSLYNIFLKGELANFPILKPRYKYILRATRLHSDKNQKGILVLEQNDNAEFFPFINNLKKKNLKFNYKNDVKFVIKYRYLYQYKALNVYLFNYKKPKIFIFETEKEAQEIYEFLIENCEKIEKFRYDIKSFTNLWVDGFISNFEYLLYLNEMASRSFSDLSQYPVMPWVINNYNDEDCKFIY